ncbi:MAG: WD40 repeat domain-containing protein [Candidatus Hodarchaeales archaeon]
MLPQSTTVFSGVTGHRFSVMRLSPFHHSDRIASCSFDGTVRVWENNKQHKVLFFFSEAIEGLEVTPDDSKIIVVLSDSSKIFIIDLETNNLSEIGGGHVFRSLFPATSPDSSKTAVITFDDDLFIYNHHNQSMGSRVFVENISGDSLIWLDNETCCIPKRDGNVAIIDSNTRTIKRVHRLHDGLITSICRDGDEIVTVSEDGTGKIHDLEFNPKFGFKIKFTPQSVCYSAKNKLIIVAGDRNLLFVDVHTGELTLTKQELTGCNAIINHESQIYRGTGEHDITEYSNTGQELKKILGREGTAEAVAFLREDELLYGSGDNSVHLFNFTSGNDEKLVTHSETVSDVLYNSVTHNIIASSFDDTISIYNLETKTELNRIKDIPLPTTLALSPSKDFFAAGCSADNSIHVFHSTGEEFASWKAHEDYISAIFFLNDEVVISGSDDKSVRFWKPNGKLLSSLKMLASVKALHTTPEFDYTVIGLENGDLLLFEKISNREIAKHTISASIQCIKVIDDTLIFFAAKNILYRMELDGPNIISVKEVTHQTEPIRGLYWNEKAKKITSIDYSIEIVETKVIDNLELTSDTSSTTVEFAPIDSYDELQPEVKEKLIDEEGQHSIKDTDSLIKIKEYLSTISKQLTDLIQPKLKEIGINSEPLQMALQEIEEQVKGKLNHVKDVKVSTSDQFDEKKSEWKNYDWGKRKR